MKKFALLTAVAATLAGTAMVPVAFAAKPHPVKMVKRARAPAYTGDAAVDKLNQQQLDQARVK